MTRVKNFIHEKPNNEHKFPLVSKSMGELYLKTTWKPRPVSKKVVQPVQPTVKAIQNLDMPDVALKSEPISIQAKNSQKSMNKSPEKKVKSKPGSNQRLKVRNNIRPTIKYSGNTTNMLDIPDDSDEDSSDEESDAKEEETSNDAPDTKTAEKTRRPSVIEKDNELF
eukprot:UN30168